MLKVVTMPGESARMTTTGTLLSFKPARPSSELSYRRRGQRRAGQVQPAATQRARSERSSAETRGPIASGCEDGCLTPHTRLGDHVRPTRAYWHKRKLPTETGTESTRAKAGEQEEETRNADAGFDVDRPRAEWTQRSKCRLPSPPCSCATRGVPVAALCDSPFPADCFETIWAGIGRGRHGRAASLLGQFAGERQFRLNGVDLRSEFADVPIAVVVQREACGKVRRRDGRHQMTQRNKTSDCHWLCRASSRHVSHDEGFTPVGRKQSHLTVRLLPKTC